ncbi:MAG: hypothetical protein N2446_02330, partial [Elusimicrobiales bacterium]|nr:hypothetical protein [Elusimicrobiales bacterium]
MKKNFIFFVLIFILFDSYSFSQQLYVSSIAVRDCGGNTDRATTPYPSIEFDDGRTSYPGGCLDLCAWITAVVKTTANHFMGVDDLTFEIFKFRPGSNPLDPSSSPPIRTISLYNVTAFSLLVSSSTQGPFCTRWDGSYNVEGFWGKTNGFFGFRVTVRTNEVSPTAGNINIQQTSVFPGEDQYPIKVDVVNIHVVKATPTVVGKITGVGAQPYNILYRLSKDATTTITIESPPNNVIRTIINNLPRFGEGIPDGTLTNGDYWDGRDNEGRLVQPGNYIYRIRASAIDTIGWDNANEYIGNISIEPLQITDVSVKDLGPLATDVAIISFMLTEDATVYLDIYPPGTQFNNINCANRSTSCGPTLNGNSVNPLRSYMDTKPRRQTVSFYWDGKDENGRYLCDGQYAVSYTHL